MDQREPWNEASIGLSPMRAEIDVGLGKRVSRFALAALFVGYVAFIVVNGLSISGKLGPTNAEVSDLYPTPITPDGITFSIWGIIFLTQGLGVLYSVLGTEGQYKADAVRNLAVLWNLGWALSSIWEAIFVLETKVGMISCAIALLTVAIVMNISSVKMSRAYCRGHVMQSLAFNLPSSIFAGWVSIASCVGILVVGVAFDVAPQTLVNLSFALLSIVLCVGLAHIYYVRDFYFAYPLTWGLLGVSRTSYGEEVCTECDGMGAIQTFAMVAAIIVACSGVLVACYQLYQKIATARQRVKTEGTRSLLTTATPMASPV